MISVFSRLFLSALITSYFVSCAPKDTLLNPNQAANAVTLDIQKAKDKKDYNRLLALNLDRSFEAIALLSATMNPEMAARFDLELIQNDNIIADDLQSLPPLSLKNKMNTSSRSSQFLSKTNYRVEELSIDEKSKLVRLVLKSENEKLETKHFLNTQPKSAFVLSNNLVDRILITATAQQNEYMAVIEKVEEMGLSRNVISFVHSQIKMKFIWSGEAKDLMNEILVTSLMINSRMHGARSGAVIGSDLQAQIKVQLAECIRADGSVQFKTGDLVKPISLVDSTVNIAEDQFKSEAQSCHLRPRVDYTRMIRL